MHSSLLVVVAVVVVAASPTLTASRLLLDHGQGVRGWAGGRGPLPDFHPRPAFFPRGGHEFHPRPDLLPRGGHDFHKHLEDPADSSFQISPKDDLNRRITEAQRRCHDDLLLLRRLLGKRGHPARGPRRGFPWFFPVLRAPHYPEQDQDVQHPTPSDPHAPGPVWHRLPFLPRVPSVDDLPDHYDNATHTIHVVNGTRVEVNTTTNKDTDDTITTFFHTEVIHILPNEDPKVNTPEEEQDNEGTFTTDEETTQAPEEEEESTTTESPEEPPVEEDTTRNESPFYPRPVPAELVVHEVRGSDVEAARAFPRVLTPRGQRSASYVKRRAGGNTKGKDPKQPPKDLSGDTLVNSLPRDTKGDKPEDPDAERINEELRN